MTHHTAHGMNGVGGSMQTAAKRIAVKSIGRISAGLRAGLMAVILIAGLSGVQAQAAVTTSLTAPAANSSYKQWTNVILTADAVSTAGSISTVAFYGSVGGVNNLLGSVNYPPYNFSWNVSTGGDYLITAVATDTLGVQTTSSALPLKVVTPPIVSLTSPVANSAGVAPASFTLSADASSLGTIAQVEFYNGTTLLGTTTASPYSYTWNNVAAGSYTLSAKAIDTLGQSTTSPVINVTSATPPYVALSSPANNSSIVAPGPLTLTASAWGTSSGLKSVSFYNGTTLLSTVTAAPYSYTWNNIAAGSYSLTAHATDNNNLSSTSGAVNLSVVATNQPPSVSLSSPAVNSSYKQWTNVILTAAATASATASIAKVDFYANDGTNSNLIGSVAYPPYSLSWNAGVGGHYTLTAVATDTLGAQTTSAATAINVVVPPTVSLTSPVANSAGVAPASFTLSANASSLGTIAQVEFYNGTTLLGTTTASPYSYTWSNVAAGTYTLSAKAIDTLGQSTTSPVINVTSATPPYVALSSPANNSSIVAPGSLTLTASAWGTSSGLKSVSFYNGTTLLSTVTAAPYSYIWNNIAAGSYSLTAHATDNNNLSSTSGAVTVMVTGTSQPPTVSLTSPTANASTSAPGSFTLLANASSTGSTIAKVDFYQGSTLIGTATAAPYSYIWSNVAAGSYSVTAQATDALNATSSTTPIQVSVTAGSGLVKAYYIYSDQLDT
ncbi:MAG: Ig-like domain-containing protein, partial [Gallionella sp.]